MSDQHLTAEKASKLLRLATYASVTTASVLIVAKLVAWFFTGSVSVLASLMDSVLDAGASVTNLLAIRVALRPPDADHRFGHGKAESLAGLAQATFVAGSALFLVFEAVDRLRHPRPIEEIGVGVGVFVFAIVATAILLSIQRYVVQKTGSTAIRADALHYVTDLATALGTILALVLAHSMNWASADGWIALIIAAFIFHSAWHIARDAMHVLMDRELPDDQRQRIKDLALENPGVRGIHDLRTRQSGMMQIIQFHLDLDGGLSLFKAHAIADDVERRVRAAFPNADVIIHQDPIKVA